MRGQHAYESVDSHDRSAVLRLDHSDDHVDYNHLLVGSYLDFATRVLRTVRCTVRGAVCCARRRAWHRLRQR